MNYTSKERELIEFSVSNLLQTLFEPPALNYMLEHTQVVQVGKYNDKDEKYQSQILICKLDQYFNYLHDEVQGCIYIRQAENEAEPKIRVNTCDLITSLMSCCGQKERGAEKDLETFDEGVFDKAVEINGVLHDFTIKYEKSFSGWLTISGKELTKQWNQVLKTKKLNDFVKVETN